MQIHVASRPSVDEREKKNVGAWGEQGIEKQRALYSSRAMVVGSDVLAQMVLANLMGLGIRNLCCIDEQTIGQDDRYNFLYQKGNGNKRFLGEKRVEHIADTLEEINPLLDITYYGFGFEGGCAEEFGPEVVIDATNDPRSKERCLHYCVQKGLPLISVASGEERSELSVWNPNESGLEGVIRDGFPPQQGSYTSGVVAGLAAEQFRKLKFRISDNGLDEPLETGRHVVYNPHRDVHTAFPFEDLSVLVVGAGAVGNFVALNLALLGIGNTDIVDGDKIEHHNLNRQLLLYGKEGDAKAEVLSERLRGINNSVRGGFYKFYLTEETAGIVGNGKRYNAVFGCVDNYTARYLLNRLAVEHHIPYIDGGTSAHSGRVDIYVPGQNRCIDCQLDLKKLSEREEKEKSENAGCAYNPDPAIVIPNIIIGSAMVAEFVNILSGNPQLLRKTFGYDTCSSRRIYLQRELVTSTCGLGC